MLGLGTRSTGPAKGLAHLCSGGEEESKCGLVSRIGRALNRTGGSTSCVVENHLDGIVARDFRSELLEAPFSERGLDPAVCVPLSWRLWDLRRLVLIG